MKPKLALIAGPTASGKSALALALAERHDGVVINADASQVYADLRILSARPSPQEEARAPHLLFGHVDGADLGYSAARWAVEAKAAIAAVHAEGRLPILVGGTGLYLRTLIDGISPVPPVDPLIRAEVRAASVAANHVRLAAIDPAAAARLNPADSTRVARALEVILSSGRPLADWHVETAGGIGAAVDLVATVLLPPRDWLRARCDARFADMFESGAVDEVRRLLARSEIPPEASVRRAIGVAEITQWLEGRITPAKAVIIAQIATRQYAKRQSTWFNNQPPVAWQRCSTTETIENLHNIEIRLHK